MELLTREIKDIKELKKILEDNNKISKDHEVAVILYAFDKNNKIIFQRRGPVCRDERMKLGLIGGRVEETDIEKGIYIA